MGKSRENMVRAEYDEFKETALKLLSLNMAFESARGGSLGPETEVMQDIIFKNLIREGEKGER